ncbi:hypothetical protein FACS1894174_04620 [Bacteroidia bacterium]|nr:hypothetical protein FACS189455_2600 [Bacteroidia bacterium]GHV21345.1 hypothetical protein FACS1894174_04620 [Bacteroidia bacterium]
MKKRNSASIRANLLNFSQSKSLTFQFVITRFLHEAIIQTFRQRNTFYIENHELFSDSFYEDAKRVMMWNTFLTKMKIKDNLDFQTVVNEITSRLKPFYSKINAKIDTIDF